MFSQLLEGCRHLLYPSVCNLCRKLLNQNDDFCGDCRAALLADPHATCPRCASTVGPFVDLSEGCTECGKERFHFQGAIRLGVYDGSLRDAVLSMKHLPGQNLAHALGTLWANHARERFQSLQLNAIVPIPLHWWRRWRRGYNQSAGLGEAMAEVLGVPCRTDWLRRTRSTPHQTSLSATARAENVKAAFAFTRRAKLAGLRILLIDDVLTTGSTAHEAAGILKKAGAVAVHLAVLARH